MTSNVVEVACPCPGTPHTIDTVTLHPSERIPLQLGIAALAVIKAARTQAEMEAGLAEVFLEFGIASWTLTAEPDREGFRRPIPINRDTITEYLRWPAGLEVAEAADRLYGSEVMRPLVERLARSSLPTPTEPSTSASSATGAPPPTHSRRSSPNGTAGKASAVLDR